MSDLKTIRSYIRLVAEAAVKGTAAVKGGMALYKRGSGRFKQYILYNPAALKARLEDPSSSEPVVTGYVQTKQRSGDCNNSAQVTASVANKGFGPLMYDLVMADSPEGIMPDRDTTSPAAKKVWQYYAEKRKRAVKTTPFTDLSVKKPGQKEEKTDCYMTDDPVLDQSFKGKGEPRAFTSLAGTHEAFMASLGDRREEAEDILFSDADSRFNAAI
jgi:hypothetical protein